MKDRIEIIKTISICLIAISMLAISISVENTEKELKNITNEIKNVHNAYDVNYDGKVDSKDMLNLRQYLLEHIDE